MNILGIETSCDETAAAVVNNGKYVLSNVVASSLRQHKKYGGVIPEIASRQQVRTINPVIRQALLNAKLNWRKIRAIAVTERPGLIGSLLVGMAYARALSYAFKKPLILTDHVKAHLYAAFLRFPQPHSSHVPLPRLPAIGLIVSGGHTSLYHIRDPLHIRCLGQTRDDAAGEAFDKVARILGLGYPGGPVIDRLSRRRSAQAPKSLHFSSARLPGSFDFSFSGIKTAVLYYTQKHPPSGKSDVSRIAGAFQESVISNLVEKSFEACRQMKVSNLVIGGGVAANSRLREMLQERAANERVRVSIPDFSLCMDNAAMVAGWSYHVYQDRHKRRRK